MSCAEEGRKNGDVRGKVGRRDEEKRTVDRVIYRDIYIHHLIMA